MMFSLPTVSDAAREAALHAQMDRDAAEFSRAIVALAATGVAPERVADMTVRVARRHGSRVFLTVANERGDFIAGSHCDLHGEAIFDGCLCP